MSMTAQIRRYIHDLPELQMFASKHLLQFATRRVVDITLWKMVEEEQIIRLARGVFVKAHKQVASIELKEIVEFKAAVFDRRLITAAANAAHQLGLSKSGKSNTFAINGRTSSFWVFNNYNTVITLQGICQRKMQESHVGLAIRALWHLGKKKCSAKAVEIATSQFNTVDREEVRTQASIWMPSWLHDFIFELRNKPKPSSPMVKEQCHEYRPITRLRRAPCSWSNSFMTYCVRDRTLQKIL